MSENKQSFAQGGVERFYFKVNSIKKMKLKHVIHVSLELHYLI